MRAEQNRVTQQLIDAERSSTECSADAAATILKAVGRESEALCLESQTLSSRVASTLERGIQAATEDLAAAQRKEKRNGSGGRSNISAPQRKENGVVRGSGTASAREREVAAGEMRGEQGKGGVDGSLYAG